MLLLLPPSEGKARGGTGAPLDLDSLSFPSLTSTRRQLVTSLESLAESRPDDLRAALGLSAGQQDELVADSVLTTSATLPAWRRYTGVLYDALDYGSLSGPARRRASSSIVVVSALFGLVRPGDRLPAYRLSGTTRLPGIGGLPALWRPVLEPELAAVRGLVVDLRSGPYAALARVDDAVRVRVLREAQGVRTVVSHDNKHTKGALARLLCQHGARTPADVAEVGREVADDVELVDGQVDLVLHGLASARASHDQDKI